MDEALVGGAIALAVGVVIVVMRRRRFGAASTPLLPALGVVVLMAAGCAVLWQFLPDDDVASRSVFLGVLVVVVIVLRVRQGPARTDVIQRFVGQPVRVTCLEEPRGPVRHVLLEGRLVAVGQSQITLAVSGSPLPGRFRRLEKRDGTAKVSVHDVVEVTCGDEVVQLF